VGTAVGHRSRVRKWLGTRFGVDESGGDRIARRITHGLGAALLIYFVLPAGFFLVLPKEYVLLVALAAVWAVEGLRHLLGFGLPMIRPYEEHRIASYAFYAVALVGAVLLFPEPIAAAVILGTALVDPVAGELRQGRTHRALYPALPFVVYVLLAIIGLALVGAWPLAWAIPLAIGAGVVALVAEFPKIPWIDDDLAMTFAPALLLYLVGTATLHLPS
jgi:hypothetical protein